MIEQVKIGVVIPAHNEERFIQQVVETIPSFVDYIVVVDDDSTDATSQRAQEAQHHAEVIVISSESRGVGAAIDSGHKHLLEHLNPPFVSAILAGDGQMDPDDLESIVLPLIKGEADYVKGNRSLHRDGLNAMPIQRKLATSILTIATTLASGKQVSDPQCGYCAMTSEVIQEWDFQRSWKGYGYPNFWLIRLSSLGFRVKEVPVRSVYNDSSSGIQSIPFFVKVGVMMTIEHHRRNFSWILGANRTPHSFFAFIAYALGWSMFLPMNTTLEIELISRGIPSLLSGLLFWTVAHIFDRLSARTQERLRTHGKRRA
ncbi:MAG: glycosyltransferase family 2 protein [Candidatus Poseidoniales archaeon]